MGKVCKFCLCFKKGTDDKTDDQCRNHLENWEKWIERRRKLHAYLTEKLGRPPGELVMNSFEEYRKVKEEKCKFEYTRVNTYYDKYRGNPEWWRLPYGLPDKLGYRDPIYFAVKTKEEKNEIPYVDFVGIHDYILDEKNVLPRTRDMWKRWKNNSYRMEQIRKLSSKIKEINPHIPLPETMIVVATKMGNKEETTIEPVKSEQLETFITEKRRTLSIAFDVHTIPKKCFEINENQFSDSDVLIDSSRTVRLLFDCTDSDESLRSIKFVNKGTTTLRFIWTKFEKFRTFRSILPIVLKDSPFYFDNNEILLLPGKTLELPVWLKLKTAGNFFETWELTTNPKFWENDFQLLVSFETVAFRGVTCCQYVKELIDARTRNSLIKDILNDLLNVLKYEDRQSISYLFSKEMLFENANQETCGIKKRKKYCYKQSVVDELVLLYNNVRQSGDPQTWNYSMTELECMVRKKDIIDYVNREIQKCEKSRERIRELQYPSEESSVSNDPAAQKIRKPSSFIKDGEPPKPDTSSTEDVEYQSNLDKFISLIHQLESPLMLKNYDKEKYSRAYLILRFYLSKMSNALDYFETRCKEPEDFLTLYNYKSTDKVEDLPEWLIYERFDDMWIERTKLVPSDHKVDYMVTPKPEKLKNVPQDQVQTVYKLYFGNPTQGKTKEHKEEPTPSKTMNMSMRKSKSYVDSFEGPARINFDPYSCEGYADKPEQVCSIVDTIKTPSEQSYKKIDVIPYNDKYLIIYDYLCKAVDAMVDTLETLKDDTLSPTDFTRLVKCNVISKQDDKSDNSSIQEDSQYYQFLIDMNLNKNQNVQMYLIEGSTVPPDSKALDREILFEDMRQITEDIINTIPVNECSTHSMEAQTSFETYEQFENILESSLNTQIPFKESIDIKEKYSNDDLYFQELYPINKDYQ